MSLLTVFGFIIGMVIILCILIIKYAKGDDLNG